jgi:hypothetical protein
MGAMITEDRFGVVQVTFDPAALGAGPSVAEQTVTVPGVKPGDLVFAVKPTLTATMFSAQARVSAANTVELTLVATAGTPNAGSETWTFFWFRPERVTTVVNA